MQEQPFIHGVKNEEEKADVTDALNKWAKDARVSLEGEQQKTEEEIKMIQTVNEFIAEEFKRLEIQEPFIPIDPEQVHLLSRETYQRKFDMATDDGSAHPVSHEVYIVKDDFSRNYLFSTLLHEILHMASHQKFYADTDNHNIYDYRVGYRLRNQKEEDLFRGFNEIMTDFTLFKIWGRHRDDLEAKLSFTKDEANNTAVAYFVRYKSLLDDILKRVAEHRNEKPEQTADRFSKGMFTGEMMHLRDVEKVYGENAIEVLSLLGKKDVSRDEMEAIDKKVRGYFYETDKEKRKAIAEELLKK